MFFFSLSRGGFIIIITIIIIIIIISSSSVVLFLPTRTMYWWIPLWGPTVALLYLSKRQSKASTSTNNKDVAHMMAKLSDEITLSVDEDSDSSRNRNSNKLLLSGSANSTDMTDDQIFENWHYST